MSFIVLIRAFREDFHFCSPIFYWAECSNKSQTTLLKCFTLELSWATQASKHVAHRKHITEHISLVRSLLWCLLFINKRRPSNFKMQWTLDNVKCFQRSFLLLSRIVHAFKRTFFLHVSFCYSGRQENVNIFRTFILISSRRYHSATFLSFVGCAIILAEEKTELQICVILKHLFGTHFTFHCPRTSSTIGGWKTTNATPGNIAMHGCRRWKWFEVLYCQDTKGHWGVYNECKFLKVWKITFNFQNRL